MKAPCKDCEKRYVGCHSKCSEYNKFKQESEAIKRAQGKIEIMKDIGRGRLKRHAIKALRKEV